MKVRTGIGIDAHRLVSGRRLVLGGVEIEAEMGLEGHSDADVLCHALADALLGAIADGDIGTHFPDTDPQWRDASSLDLLGMVGRRVRAGGWDILNVDATVVAEVPRLSPHVLEMRTRIAGCLEIAVDDVSVKATTVEQLGALGRREGMAAMALAAVGSR